MAVKTLNKRKSKKKSPEEKKLLEEKRIKNKFYRNIENIFKYSGFTSYSTEGKNFHLGLRNHELDHCFVYENIIILCERTTGQKNKDHIKHKQETYETILANKDSFLNYLDSEYPNINLKKYSYNRYIIKYLYFSLNKLDISKEEEERFSPIKFVDQNTFYYFQSITDCLKKSSIYEIFKYLNITKSDIGVKLTRSVSNDFDVTILHPVDVTGYNNVRMVSFMISPGDVIENAYVLRKDNWEESMDMYQRMVKKNRINAIRKFVVKGKKTFLNNIILSLPNGLVFKDGDKVVKKENMNESKCYTMTLKNEFNSIGIIDGQHRVYAHYENNVIDSDEIIMSSLRKQLNLLATGIIYPDNWDDHKKRVFESELFLEINKNPQKVKSDLIMYIEMSKNPFDDSSIAREILTNLNNKGVLKGLFQMSSLEKAPIKMTSIIKYALKGLVSTDANQENLFKYWTPEFDKNLIKNDFDYRKKYVDYCTSILNQYFSAIKSNYQDDFENKNSMILRVISINGFLIGLRLSLGLTNGPKDYTYYHNVFSSYHIEFSKEKFKYAGSRYSQFAENIIIDEIFKPYLFKNQEN